MSFVAGIPFVERYQTLYYKYVYVVITITRATLFGRQVLSLVFFCVWHKQHFIYRTEPKNLNGMAKNIVVLWKRIN